MVAKRLPGVHIGNMDLHHWRGHGGNGIAKSQRRMCISTGVEDYPIGRKSHIVDSVNKLALVVTLKICQLHRRILRVQRFEIVFEPMLAINTLFTHSQQVQVGSIDDDDPAHSGTISKKKWI